MTLVSLTRRPRTVFKNIVEKAGNFALVVCCAEAS